MTLSADRTASRSLRAETVAPLAAEPARGLVRAALARLELPRRNDLIELGALLCVTYPALASLIHAHPENLVSVAPGLRHARDVRAYRRLAQAARRDDGDSAGVGRALRRLAAREKLRVAARELLAHPGQDIDVTARELADLADVCCEVALAEALAWATGRFGAARTAKGEPCPFVVVGMGKLGGRELNAGSDIDITLFYETDDGAADGCTLHEYFTRVAQRFVATLDESTSEGAVWRVNLRLRPEGTRGPLVNALASAERYYETWGRTWERAALVRARPVAGDLAFGEQLLDTLSPFVWRRTVDPRLADEMAALLSRARADAADGVDDLKLGSGASAKSSSSLSRFSSSGAAESPGYAERIRSTRCDVCAPAASSASARSSS